MRTVDDPTPLNGATIDVAARVAWVVRMARVTAEDAGDTRLRTMAQRLGSSAAQLSRVETGQRRDGRLVDGYERELGLPEGSLRAPIDILCRTFPSESPRDLDPGTPVEGVRALSRLTEQLLSDEPVTGGTWLRWARTLAQPGNIALPESMFERLVTRLVDELARSVGHAYPTRYEALALLRCSDYGGLVLEVARAQVARPYAQGLADLMSGVGEAVTADAVDWCVTLLLDEREHVAVCGALALENMAQVAGDDFWPRVATDLLEAFDRVERGSVHEEWIAHLIRLAPRSVWREGGTAPGRPLPPAPSIPAWTRDETNRLWADCEEKAGEVTAELGLSPQPMLARLLFDIAYGHWESRAVTAYMLLSGVPRLMREVGVRMAGCVDDEEDAQVRARMTRRLVGVLQGHPLPSSEQWLRSDDPDRRRTALVAAATAGQVLPRDVLERALVDPETSRQALYALGMSHHPAMPVLASDTALPHDVRGALGWWLERGGRIAQ